MLNKFIQILFVVLFIGALVSCKKEVKQEESSRNSPTEVSLSKKQVQLNEIQTGSPQLKLMSHEIVANGNVDVPPQYKATISIAVGGFIKSTEVLEGDHVHQGEVLAVLTHPDYVQIQQQYLESISKDEFLQKELERQQYLRDENVNSKKDLERIQSELKINVAQLRALEARLKILGINPDHVAKGNISPTVEIRSPLSGDVTMVSTTLGKFVRPEEVLFEVVSKEHLHLDLRVYETDVLKIKPGQNVSYTLGNDDEVVRHAKVFLVGKKLDPVTRTVSIHAHPVDEGQGMLPGMYVKARILSEEKETSTVPQEAIIREGENNFVFLQKGSSKDSIDYDKYAVKVGMIQNDLVEVNLPVKEFENKVVVKGAYYIASQLKKMDAGD